MTSRLPRLARSAGTRPKVLLVDDHRGVLGGVAAMLGSDFDVAGVATDGWQAVDVARDIDPDVIVLDVNMPGLDGFQTFRQLEQSGSRAPVVFLSMVDTEEHVSEAFRCGGHGYVLKTRITRDLPSALDHALSGRRFAPSLPSLFHLAGDGGHAMAIHADTTSFLDSLGALLDLALRRGDATCAIATADVREGLEVRLRARGWDVGGATGHKRYLVMDATEALSRFMRGGRPDAGLLAGIAAELDQYRLGVGDGAAPRLTVIGNMVTPLSEDGNREAVLELERVWNSLTAGLPIFTLCGYAASCFHDRVPGLYDGVCAEHRVVSHAGDLGAV